MGKIAENFKKWAESRMTPFSIKDIVESGVCVSSGYSGILSIKGVQEGWLVLVRDEIPRLYKWAGKERVRREELISEIEGYTGSLLSVPWSRVSTEDLIKLRNTFRYHSGKVM